MMHFFTCCCCFFLLANNPFSFLHAVLLENDFYQVNEIILRLHRPPIAKKLHSKLELKERFYSFGGAFRVDSVFKTRSRNKFIITLTGQVSKIERMNMDGYAIMVCHEIGHILGGEPRQKQALSSWSSVEGQADYFATNTCMWRYVKGALTSTDVIHEFDYDVVKRCDRAFSTNTKKLLGCLRIMSGIKAMIYFFNETISKNQHVSLKRFDNTVVKKTLQKYPSPQCRIDTFVAGLFDQSRPSCWYKK